MKTLVILGNRMNDDASPSQLMLKRMEIALYAIEHFRPDNIVVCGGIANPTANIAEAHWMKQYLTDKGVTLPIICEDKSLTTKQNAQFCSEILSNWDVDTIYLCTTPEHMNRLYLNPKRLFRHYTKKQHIRIVAVSKVKENR